MSDTRAHTLSNGTAGQARKPASLSAPAYFVCVFFVTAAFIAAAALISPTLATDLSIWSGLSERPRAEPQSFYSVRVAPLLDKRCVSCHKSGRQKGKLRLDTFAGVMRGGRSGQTVEANRFDDSELYQRLILPSDDDKAMPPKGAKPLSEDEITVIKLWIAHGASGSLPVGAIKGVPELIKEVVFPEIDVDAVAAARSDLANVVRDLQSRFVGVVTYESRGSADIHVNASLIGVQFSDSDLRAFRPIQKKIVALDLSRTSITDDSASLIAGMTNLRSLRLGDTNVTDTTIRSLTSLTGLQSISAFGADVSPEALASLRSVGR